MGKNNIKFMIGVMLGTAFGMAFAPKKGKELRNELVKDIKDGKGERFLEHNAKLVGKDVVDTTKEVYESDEVQSKIKEGKSQASKFTKKIKSKMKSRAGEWTEVARNRLEEVGIKTSATSQPKAKKPTFTKKNITKKHPKTTKDKKK